MTSTRSIVTSDLVDSSSDSHNGGSPFLGPFLDIGSSPALAGNVDELEWDAEGSSIDTWDGTITDVYITPIVHLEWSGFSSGQSEVGIQIDAEVADNSDESAIGVVNTSVTAEGTSGQDDFPQDQVAITGEDAIDPAVFEAPEDGETTETEIVLTLRMDVSDPDIATLATDTFVVEVSNVEGEITAGGSSTTEIESDQEVIQDDGGEDDTSDGDTSDGDTSDGDDDDGNEGQGPGDDGPGVGPN